MTVVEMRRAKEARRQHCNAGHMAPALHKEILKNRLWKDTDLVPRDVDNSIRLLGPCLACTEAKFQQDEGDISMNLKFTEPGEVLFMDIEPLLVRCIGGYYFFLLSIIYLWPF